MLRAAAKWPVWRLPTAALALVLSVDMAALLILPLSWRAAIRSEVELAVALSTLSIAYSALSYGAERLRRTLHQGAEAVQYRNLLAVWGFSAAVLLPLELAWLVAVVGAVAEWPARTVGGRAHLYRHVYSAAGAVLAAAAAHAVIGSTPERWLGIVVAVPVYIAATSVAVGAAMVSAGERSAARGLLRPGPYRAEVCCLAIAVAVVAVVDTQAELLAWLSLPAALVLQRMITRTRLRVVTDGALIRPMGQEIWFIAATEVVAAHPVVSIIRITTADPLAVSAVARMQAGADAIGYVGIDGLGMLLVDCPARSAEALAARLRLALRNKGIEAQVAAAGKPRDGYKLPDLLAICEAELVARDAAQDHLRPEA